MLLNHCRLYAPLSGGFAGEDCCVELDGGKNRVRGSSPSQRSG